MSVPPRSSTPPASTAWHCSGPSFTQEHWTWSIAPVQHQPGDRVHRPVVADRRAGAGDAGEVERRAGVHERQRHELGEPARLLLQPGAAAAGARPSGAARRRGRTSSCWSSAGRRGARSARPRPTARSAACPWSAPSGPRRRGSPPRCRAGCRRPPPWPRRRNSSMRHLHAGRAVDDLHRASRRAGAARGRRSSPPARGRGRPCRAAAGRCRPACRPRWRRRPTPRGPAARPRRATACRRRRRCGAGRRRRTGSPCSRRW